MKTPCVFTVGSIRRSRWRDRSRNAKKRQSRASAAPPAIHAPDCAGVSWARVRSSILFLLEVEDIARPVAEPVEHHVLGRAAPVRRLARDDEVAARGDDLAGRVV